MDSERVLQTLKGLRAGRDIDAVRSAILGLSGPSGPVKSYSVSFDSIRKTVFCFLEMRSPMLDSEIRELGAYGFGNAMCLEFAPGGEFTSRLERVAPG
jgi:hypothetical protein